MHANPLRDVYILAFITFLALRAVSNSAHAQQMQVVTANLRLFIVSSSTSPQLPLLPASFLSAVFWLPFGLLSRLFRTPSATHALLASICLVDVRGKAVSRPFPEGVTIIIFTYRMVLHMWNLYATEKKIPHSGM